MSIGKAISAVAAGMDAYTTEKERLRDKARMEGIQDQQLAMQAESHRNQQDYFQTQKGLMELQAMSRGFESRGRLQDLTDGLNPFDDVENTLDQEAKAVSEVLPVGQEQPHQVEAVNDSDTGAGGVGEMVGAGIGVGVPQAAVRQTKQWSPSMGIGLMTPGQRSSFMPRVPGSPNMGGVIASLAGQNNTLARVQGQQAIAGQKLEAQQAIAGQKLAANPKTTAGIVFQPVGNTKESAQLMQRGRDAYASLKGRLLKEMGDLEAKKEGMSPIEYAKAYADLETKYSGSIKKAENLMRQGAAAKARAQSMQALAHLATFDPEGLRTDEGRYDYIQRLEKQGSPVAISIAAMLKSAKLDESDKMFPGMSFAGGPVIPFHLMQQYALGAIDPVTFQKAVEEYQRMRNQNRENAKNRYSQTKIAGHEATDKDMIYAQHFTTVKQALKDAGMPETTDPNQMMEALTKVGFDKWKAKEAVAGAMNWLKVGEKVFGSYKGEKKAEAADAKSDAINTRDATNRFYSDLSAAIKPGNYGRITPKDMGWAEEMQKRVWAIAGGDQALKNQLLEALAANLQAQRTGATAGAEWIPDRVKIINAFITKNQPQASGAPAAAPSGSGGGAAYSKD